MTSTLLPTDSTFVYLIEGWISLLGFFVLGLVKLFALIDAVVRPAKSYAAMGKLTKPGWLLILFLSLAVHVVWASPLSIFSLAGTVAAFVYLLDVRPALVARR